VSRELEVCGESEEWGERDERRGLEGGSAVCDRRKEGGEEGCATVCGEMK